MGPATAPAPERQSPKLTIHPLLQQFIFAAAMAAIGWAVATGQASAVQEQRLSSVEEQVKVKASKESMDELKREVLSRLDRIENKIDRADKRVR
jgi:hypothetical protein